MPRVWACSKGRAIRQRRLHPWPAVLQRILQLSRHRQHRPWQWHRWVMFLHQEHPHWDAQNRVHRPCCILSYPMMARPQGLYQPVCPSVHSSITDDPARLIVNLMSIPRPSAWPLPTSRVMPDRIWLGIISLTPMPRQLMCPSWKPQRGPLLAQKTIQIQIQRGNVQFPRRHQAKNNNRCVRSERKDNNRWWLCLFLKDLLNIYSKCNPMDELPVIVNYEWMQQTANNLNNCRSELCPS